MSPRQASPLAVGHEPAAMKVRPYVVWIPGVFEREHGEIIVTQTANQARYHAYQQIRDTLPHIGLFDIMVRRHREGLTKVITETGAVHDACGYTLYIVFENGIRSYFDGDWQAILDGKCPRCRRRLLRSRLRLLNRPTVRGTGARQ